MNKSKAKFNYIITEDIDQLSSITQGWNQSYQQLSLGKFEGKIIEAVFDDVQIFQESVNQTVYEIGFSPRETLSICIPYTQKEGWFCGDNFTQENILLLRHDEQMKLRLPAGDYFVLNINNLFLENYFNNVEKISINPLCKHQHCISGFHHQRLLLANWIKFVLSFLKTNLYLLNNIYFQEHLQEFILEQIITIFTAQDDLNYSEKLSYNSYSLVNEINEYIENHINEPITVYNLCKIMGVSRRKIQYSFQEVLGINPKLYLMNKRLYAVHKDLQKANPELDNIGDIAFKYGFFHLGNFAKYYKNIFQKLPSDTLNQR